MGEGEWRMKKEGVEVNRGWQVKKDSDAINKAMKNYSGMDGAHFGFIAYETGERHFFCGGRVDVTGICLGEALARLVDNTPGIEDDYIDLVMNTAKDMLEDFRKERGMVQ